MIDHSDELMAKAGYETGGLEEKLREIRDLAGKAETALHGIETQTEK